MLMEKETTELEKWFDLLEDKKEEQRYVGQIFGVDMIVDNAMKNHDICVSLKDIFLNDNFEKHKKGILVHSNGKQTQFVFITSRTYNQLKNLRYFV